LGGRERSLMNPRILTDNVLVLKNIPRTGWLQRGIPPSVAETVAEHSFEVASILAVVTMEGGGKLDLERILLMGILHDWGEAVAGDMPRSLTKRLGKGAKSEAETKIMGELAEASGFKAISALFKEYEERKTPEAVVVKIADILSTLRQSRAYLARGYRVEDIEAGCVEELEELMGRVKEKRLRAFLQSLV
jgi:putative hydrolase of HD superfamily